MKSEDYDLTGTKHPWGHGVDGTSGIQQAIMLQKRPVFQTQLCAKFDR